MLAQGRALVGHLFDWAGAVVRAWWGLAAFIVTGLVVSLHDKVASTAITWQDSEVPVLVALPVAFFQAWRDERIKREAATDERNQSRQQLGAQTYEIQDKTSELLSTRRELDSVRQELDQERQRNTPNLRGEIDRIIGGPFGNDSVACTITMTIKNPPPGAESVAESFRAIVTRPGKEPEILTPTAIPDGWKLSGTFPDGSSWAEVLFERDAMYNKAKEPPIQRGGSRTGHLIVIVPSMVPVQMHGVAVQVRFVDVCGTVVVTPPWVIDNSVQSTYIPAVAGVASSYAVAPKAPPQESGTETDQ